MATCGHGKQHATLKNSAYISNKQDTVTQWRGSLLPLGVMNVGCPSVSVSLSHTRTARILSSFRTPVPSASRAWPVAGLAGSSIGVKSGGPLRNSV